jgi:phosphatidylglycerophosphatase A
MQASNRIVLWLAQGFGSGRAPVAPGTFGSLIGFPWFLLLLGPGSPALFLAGTLAGVGLAVWICGRAETLLRQKDPGSVVLDEIVAMPIVYAGWLWVESGLAGSWPSAGDCLRGSGLLWMTAGFLLFRVLDAFKPPPIHGCQRWPGGWGIVADDVAAALATAGITGLFHAWWG